MKLETPAEVIARSAERGKRVLRLPVYAFLASLAGVGLVFLGQGSGSDAIQSIGAIVALAGLAVCVVGFVRYLYWIVTEVVRRDRSH